MKEAAQKKIKEDKNKEDRKQNDERTTKHEVRGKILKPVGGG